MGDALSLAVAVASGARNTFLVQTKKTPKYEGVCKPLMTVRPTVCVYKQFAISLAERTADLF